MHTRAAIFWVARTQAETDNDRVGKCGKEVERAVSGHNAYLTTICHRASNKILLEMTQKAKQSLTSGAMSL